MSVTAHENIKHLKKCLGIIHEFITYCLVNLLKSIKILSETNVIYLQPKTSIFTYISEDLTLQSLTR